ncbi:hypothetical protein [Thalassospira alkalitolerans]|uniref:hypothetical protein n=1 Tax=Thalassospira alkalitolerans TaxID=1293890 RepID=UPI003AA7E82E
MIQINSNEIDFILRTLDLPPEIERRLKSVELSKGITDEMAEDLRERCIDLLDEVGFDNDYKLTEIGVGLDVLIDKLFVG